MATIVEFSFDEQTATSPDFPFSPLKHTFNLKLKFIIGGWLNFSMSFIFPFSWWLNQNTFLYISQCGNCIKVSPLSKSPLRSSPNSSRRGSRSLSCDAGWLPAFPGTGRLHVSVGSHAVHTGRPARWGRGRQKTKEERFNLGNFLGGVWSELEKSEGRQSSGLFGRKVRQMWRKERLLRSD